jgi:radical SAM-linked protein
MIGLPSETDTDIEGIVELCGKALRKAKSKRQRLNVSVSTFVPKPHTPFQWETQIDLNETHHRQEIIRQGLKKIASPKRLNFKWHDGRVSLLEGIFSRGGRELWPVLLKARSLGCAFDAWSDRFDYKLWQQAFTETGFDLEALAVRDFSNADLLPWSHINSRVSEKFLRLERDRALAEKTTPDCRFTECHGCGVCSAKENLKNIKVDDILSEPDDSGNDSAAISQTTSTISRKSPPEQLMNSDQPRQWRYQLSFSRGRRLSYLSHLENVAVIIRRLRRLEIPLAFSQGFHPHPKVSFSHALPVGLASEHEVMEFRTKVPIEFASLKGSWSEVMPAELKLKEVVKLRARAAALDRRLTGCKYRISIADDKSSEWSELLLVVTSSARLVIDGEKTLTLKRVKKGKLKELDLAPHLKEIEKTESGDLLINVSVLDGRNPNIFDIIATLAGLDQRPDSGIVITKVESFIAD